MGEQIRLVMLQSRETVGNCQTRISVFHRDQDVKPMQAHLQVKYLEFKMLFPA